MSHLSKVIILLVCFKGFVSEVFVAGENGPTEHLITKFSYPVESHYIETKDGYILKAHRIPHGLNKEKPKYVVLLAHGMGGNGENYLIFGQDALAFYLANRGYDVWLFNARGNNHSRKHRSLNPNIDRKKFWNFSWHEIGIYDVPATINYILNKTKVEKLFYVGHSQGTTQLFVMLSELPAMNQKIKAAVMMAPVAYLYTSPIIKFLTRFLELFKRLLYMLNWHEMVIPNSVTLNNILLSLCASKSMQDACMDIIYFIGGTDSGLVNKTLLPTILQFCPSGFAVRQMIHYAQIILSDEFKKYDYGPKKNLKLYNQTKPPLYNLSNVVAPLAFFYAKEDHLGNDLMADRLMRELPNVALNYSVTVNKWNHIDYLFAYNLKEVINEPIYSFFKKINKENDL